MRQGAFSLIRRRFTDMAFALSLLLATGIAISLLLHLLPHTDVPVQSVLLYGCGLKLPIVLIGVFLLRQRHMIGLVVPLFFVPMDLLGAVYYQQTKSMTPALQVYYQLYWDVETAVLIGAMSLLFAVGGYVLGKRLGR